LTANSGAFGAALITRLKDCIAGDPAPFVAVKTISSYIPAIPSGGVPARVFVVALKVIPEGRYPDSEIAGAGEPVAVTANDPRCASVKVTVAGLVNDAGDVPAIVKETEANTFK
jgi:hypothetical protein